MIQDWDIRPRGISCNKCSTLFEDKQAYHAVLTFGEQGYVRNDYCESCWAAGMDPGASYSRWQGIFRKPPAEPEAPLKKENAETLLRRIMDEGDPAKINVVYILAVMLERSRILVERAVQNRDDGVMVRVYEHRKTGETFMIPDPRLRLDQLQVVQLQVMNMLAPAVAQAGAASEQPPAKEAGQ